MTPLGSSTPRSNEDKRSKLLRSKAGYQFDFTKNNWQLDGGVSLNLLPLSEVLGVQSTLFESMRYTLSRLAVEASSHYTHGCINSSLLFLRSRHFSGEPITAAQLKNYRASLEPENEHRLAHLRGFLRTLVDYGQSGITSDTAAYLDTLKLKGNKKGAAVEHRCPYSGPFTTTEQATVLLWATNEFEEGNISLNEYAWFYCSFVTGRRSVNLCALRGVDLKAVEKNGVIEFRLSVPRAKQRGARYRGQFREILVGEDLYLLLKNLAENVCNQVKNSIPGVVPIDVLQELPVFSHGARIKSLRSLSDLNRILRETPDYLHANGSTTSSIIRKLSNMCSALSERTGDTIHITQTRMRRSRATNLARKGIGGTELAYLLDHSDTQQVGVYTENTPRQRQKVAGRTVPFHARDDVRYGRIQSRRNSARQVCNQSFYHVDLRARASFRAKLSDPRLLIVTEN